MRTDITYAPTAVNHGRRTSVPQVSLNTRVSPETFKLLDKYAKISGKSKASIVEEALKEYIEKNLQLIKDNEEFS